MVAIQLASTTKTKVASTVNRETEYISKTCPCQESPFKPHFYIVTLGYAGVFLSVLLLLRGCSNVNPQSIFWAKIRGKKSSGNFHFLQLKKISVHIALAFFRNETEYTKLLKLQKNSLGTIRKGIAGIVQIFYISVSEKTNLAFRIFCEADQLLCFRYTDSIILLLSKSQISSL